MQAHCTTDEAAHRAVRYNRAAAIIKLLKAGVHPCLFQLLALWLLWKALAHIHSLPQFEVIFAVLGVHDWLVG